MLHEIDLAPFDEGPSGRATVAAALDRAARDSGFILLVNHGVAPEVLTGALDAWQSFFDQPMAAKEPYTAPPELDGLMGYTPYGTQALAYTAGEASPPDLLEAFSVGREDTQGPDYDEYRAWFPANVWPDDASVRTAVEALEAELGRVATIVLGAMSTALGLPDDWLAERCERAVVTLRANHYHRESGAAPLPDQQRLGAHTDYGVMTLLVADPVPGLQVRRGDDWIDVTPPPGGIICNLGDMLSMWTNDQWVSTLHRVVPPPAGGGADRRRSIARFLDGDPSLSIEPIPSCVPFGAEPRYPVVNAGEWLMAKIVGGQTAQPVALHAGGVTGATNR